MPTVAVAILSNRGAFYISMDCYARIEVHPLLFFFVYEFFSRRYTTDLIRKRLIGR